MTQKKRELHVRLDEVLKERDMTQKQLVALTELRAATVSELVNNQRKTINRDHLTKIADALDIDDITELLTIK